MVGIQSLIVVEFGQNNLKLQLIDDSHLHDFSLADALEDASNDICSCGTSGLVLDLRQVSLLPSLVIARLAKIIGRIGRRAHVCHASSLVATMLKKLDPKSDVFVIFDSAQEAESAPFESIREREENLLDDLVHLRLNEAEGCMYLTLLDPPRRGNFYGLGDDLDVVAQSISSRVNSVVLEFSRVSWATSTTIGLLASFGKRIDKRLEVRNVNDVIRTGLETIDPNQQRFTLVRSSPK